MCDAEVDLEDCEYELEQLRAKLRGGGPVSELLRAIDAHFGYERGDEPPGVAKILELADRVRHERGDE